MSSLASTRREWLFITLAGLFITTAITAELISNKLITIGPFTTIVGILPWPIIFLLTDLINEFYGEDSLRRLSWITAALIAFCFIIVLTALQLPSAGGATDEQYMAVFGQAPWIIVGSICAFLVSQLFDATIFRWIKHKTGNRMIWLRSTGSTVISQIMDSYVVLFIGFVIPGRMPWGQYMTVAPTNYLFKLIIAIALTPLVYLGHWSVRKYLHGHLQPETA